MEKQTTARFFSNFEKKNPADLLTLIQLWFPSYFDLLTMASHVENVPNLPPPVAKESILSFLINTEKQQDAEAVFVSIANENGNDMNNPECEPAVIFVISQPHQSYKLLLLQVSLKKMLFVRGMSKN